MFQSQAQKYPTSHGWPPQYRVTPARPFLRTGIDYAGLFTVKLFNLKAVRHVKA